MIKIFNTFEPPGAGWKDIFPYFKEMNVPLKAYISRGGYREKSKNPNYEFFSYTWIPSFLKKGKKWCHVFYGLVAPFKIFFSSKKDFHFFVTQPPLFFIIGAMLSRWRGIKYGIHIMDMYPDLFAETEIMDGKSFSYRFLQKRAIQAMKKADLVLVIGRCMKNRVIGQGVPENIIKVLPNWTNSATKPIPKEENLFLKEHNLHGKFVVLYIGNMGIAHEFRTIIQVAQELKERSDIAFVFIGQGNRRKELEEYQEEPNISLLPYQPWEMFPHALSAGSVHLITLRDGFEGIMVPSKFYSSLAVGKAVLFEGSPESEVALDITEKDIGSVVPHRNVELLKETILAYADNPDKAESQGEKSLAAHVGRYEKENPAVSYFKIITDAANDR